MSLDLGRPTGPTHPTGPAGPGPSPTHPTSPPPPPGPPPPSPTSGTGAPWPARPGGSSGPGGPAGPGRAQGEQLAAVAGLLGLVIEFATALPLPSSSLGRAAKGLLIAYLRLADRMVSRIAVHDGVTIPGRGGEGAQWSAPSRPAQSTSREEVRPAPGYDVALGRAAIESGRGFADPDAGARAGDGPHAVPGAPLASGGVVRGPVRPTFEDPPGLVLPLRRPFPIDRIQRTTGGCREPHRR